MKEKKTKKKFNLAELIIVVYLIAFLINPILDGVFTVVLFILFIESPKFRSPFIDFLRGTNRPPKSYPLANFFDTHNFIRQNTAIIPAQPALARPTKLGKQQKYLQIALNSTLAEARKIISQLPISDRILLEVGTPLIKTYGVSAVSQIKAIAPQGVYIVADNKCADLASREVEMIASVGASAATCLGAAPVETIEGFIEDCQKFGIDSMVDMMNVDNPLAVLKELKKLPAVVILHRGVDESEFSKEKQIPFYQIKQIKGNYNVLVAVAGGDTIKEVQRAIFNDADIVVIWKNFYRSAYDTVQLAGSFLKEVK
ncbi:orotidine 5'-phosphate decarboxylase [Candidatus Shapirobacteria bacterium]|nr:orotidine 5'-phosphate decarboxylase [Candidatus Shapirobacteria bacterium]